MLKEYYRLTKPGIIRGNLLTAIGGFFLASQGHIDWVRLLALLGGMALVIGGSCVFNNYIDRDIDSHMARTQQRAIVSGAISGRQALSFGVSLVVAGTIILLVGTNVLTAVLGLIGLVTYVGVYTPAKHRTPYATLLGTIPGALPPVAGYTAVVGRLDLACMLLFIILICWQMPHFYAIAIRRLDEYKAADVPVWPSVHGLAGTRRHMLVYCLLFILSVMALTVAGYTGLPFAISLVVIGGYWLWLCLPKPTPETAPLWAKRIFLFSLLILPVFSGLLIVDSFISF